jgi:hypothetical protein
MAPRKATSASARRGRPLGSKNRSAAPHWFNPAAARNHLQHIEREIERLNHERALIGQLLGQAFGRLKGVASSISSSISGTFAPPRRAGRKPRGGGPSMLDLLERIIANGPANKGWTVGELRDELAKLDSVRASVANASSLISSALVQALRAKRPRFAGGKGGRGHARTYRLAKSGV